LTYADCGGFEFIPLLKILDRDAIFFGDSTESIATFDFVVDDLAFGWFEFDFAFSQLRFVSQDAITIEGIGIDMLEWHYKWIRLDIARDDVIAILRIEELEFGQRDIHLFGNLLKVNAVGNHNRISGISEKRSGRTHVVLVIKVHNVVCRNEKRHIATSFAREIRIDFPKIAFAIGNTESFGYIARTAVVGSDDKMPIAIEFV
jgi:hypothetical protein